MIENLRLVVLAGAQPDDELVPYYDRAYQHWRRVWMSTFNELDGNKKLFSDNMSRQSEILAVFDGLTCIAMVCHRLTDFRTQAARADSYFEAWPQEALDSLTSHGCRVLVPNQFSIDADRRGRVNGVSLKDILFTLSLWHMRDLDVDAITGTMRVDKNMNNFLYQSGAVPLMKDVMFHNVPVDLLAFYPKVKRITLPPDLEEVAANLWARAIGVAPLEHLKIKQTQQTRRTA